MGYRTKQTADCGPDLAEQVVLVTGASRGLGRALATRLHGEGMHVALVARSEQDLETLTDELRATGMPGQVMSFSGDVTNASHVHRIVSAVERTRGGIDLIVNNAGVTEAKSLPLWEAAPDEWWQVMTTNIRGPALICHSALPSMVARGRGRIVNINSLRGARAQPTQSAYSVSKGALALMTKNLAASLHGTGVKVFDFSPGRVNTDMAKALVAQGAMRDSGWTPMDQATDGVITIASGELDALSGHFLHAHDDLKELVRRSTQITESGGRQMALSQAFPGDRLGERPASGPA